MISEKFYLYENRKDVTLTTYILDEADQLIKGERPAVLICPGGGYLKCATQESEPVAMAFVAMGYHVFVLRYSVYFGDSAPDTLDKIKLSVKEECLYPNQMKEIAMALQLITKNRKEWNVNIDKITLCGFSAGAHNVAMYATRWQEKKLWERFQLTAVKPAAVILGYMAGESFIKGKTNTSEDAVLAECSRMALFGTKDVKQDQLEELFPERYVTKNMPPTFLWSTSEDQTVSPRDTIHMADALSREQVPFELHIFEHGPHGMALATKSSVKRKVQINATAAQWIEQVCTWLDERMTYELIEN